MQTKTRQKKSLSRFIRNNLALVIIILCLLAITAIIIVAGIESNQPAVPTDVSPGDDQVVVTPPDNDPPADQGDEPITQPETETYGLPVNVDYSVGMDYTTGIGDDLFVYNSTLNVYQTHKAIDFLVPAGSYVISLKSGTVTEVGNSIELGSYVVVDHGEGVIATYASLDNVTVSAGQTLQKGEILGKASESAYYEFLQGAHVHLSMTVNAETVNPWEYVNEKKSGIKLPTQDAGE